MNSSWVDLGFSENGVPLNPLNQHQCPHSNSTLGRKHRIFFFVDTSIWSLPSCKSNMTCWKITHPLLHLFLITGNLVVRGSIKIWPILRGNGPTMTDFTSRLRRQDANLWGRRRHGRSIRTYDISSVSLMFENHSNPRFPGSLYHPRLITLLPSLPPVNWLALLRLRQFNDAQIYNWLQKRTL